jgi:hypothetical protein
MSQAIRMMAGMKTRLRSPICTVVQLLWQHDGAPCRVSPWPEVAFERLVGDAWCACDPDEESIAAAAAAITPLDWQEYLEYATGPLRELLLQFRAGRIAVLQVLARCPGLVADLLDTPALASFLAAHRSLRAEPAARWGEINAVYGRAGIFGLLEWLGLPASRQTLSILRNLVQPDLPLRYLEPLRARLWEPDTLGDLKRRGSISARFLERFCHPMAA